MDVSTPREFFEKVLPAKFNPAKTAGLETIIQMKISGPAGGEWTLTLKDQKLEIKEGSHSAPSLAVEMSDKDFLDVVNEKVSGTSAFLNGKIKFRGSLSVALKLRDLGLM